uniref:Uncharacterized protein n=1 Tax=Rhizophora mucronata TaxID=61149 RepID=A0A2P2NMB3_RHIMU
MFNRHLKLPHRCHYCHHLLSHQNKYTSSNFNSSTLL